MNKSTPINQIPAIPNQQPFLNESQRQIVTGAQKAVGNMAIPQNTQSMEMANDEEMEIQEALNDINMQINGPPPAAPPPQPPMMQPAVSAAAVNAGMPQIRPPPTPEEEMYMRGAMYVPPNIQQQMQSQQHIMQPQMVSNEHFTMQNQQAMGAPWQQQQQEEMPQQPATFNQILTKFADDVKLAILIVVVVILVHFIPFASFIGKYFAIEKIPYHNIIIIAFVSAVLIILLKNLIIKK